MLFHTDFRSVHANFKEAAAASPLVLSEYKGEKCIGLVLQLIVKVNSGGEGGCLNYL